MSSPIKRLLSLQDVDRKIRRLRQEAEDVPARREHIESGVQRERDAVAEAEEQLQLQQSATKQLELDIEAAKEKINTLRKQQFEVKNNEAYRALEREIETLKGMISGREDEELVLMEKMEQANQFVREKEAELKKGEEYVKADLARLDERLAEIETQVTSLESDRQTRLADIEPDWLARYERLLKHTGNYAVVPVEKENCGGCHMKIPPQVIHDARRGTEMVTCPYCARLLYWQP